MRAVCWLLGAAACGGAQRGRADSAVRRVWRAGEGGRGLRAPVAGRWCQLPARRRRSAPGGRGRGRRAAGGRVRARVHHARDRRRRARQCVSCTLHVPHALYSTMRRTAHAALRVAPPGWACGPCSRGRRVVGDLTIASGPVEPSASQHRLLRPTSRRARCASGWSRRRAGRALCGRARARRLRRARRVCGAARGRGRGRAGGRAPRRHGDARRLVAAGIYVGGGGAARRARAAEPARDDAGGGVARPPRRAARPRAAARARPPARQPRAGQVRAGSRPCASSARMRPSARGPAAAPSIPDRARSPPRAHSRAAHAATAADAASARGRRPREERRPRAASPPARARSPRRAPSPRRPPSPRRKEPEHAGGVRAGARPYTALERDYSDAAHRYAHLYLSADFAKAVVHWPQARGPSGRRRRRRAGCVKRQGVLRACSAPLYRCGVL